MHKLYYPGIPKGMLPNTYIIKTKKELEYCKQYKLPYIIWNDSDEELIRLLFYPTLKKMFPYIKWNLILDMDKVEKLKNNYCEDGSVNCTGCNGEHDKSLNIYDSVGDLESYVNLEVLQQLKLLPNFLADIVDNIKKEMGAISYKCGYNKKLGMNVGTYEPQLVSKNLVIIDVSRSIPIGIANTMLALANTLREELYADLIITGGNSGFYEYNVDTLPTPQVLRKMYPRYNETRQYECIIFDKLKGKHYNNVISFGDDDCYMPDICDGKLEGVCRSDTLYKDDIKFNHVHHYHTRRSGYRDDSFRTGYARWICDINNLVPETIHDGSGCHFMEK